eukprot:285785-Chlamydomonas_euryale.AAC.1
MRTHAEHARPAAAAVSLHDIFGPQAAQQPGRPCGNPQASSLPLTHTHHHHPTTQIGQLPDLPNHPTAQTAACRAHSGASIALIDSSSGLRPPPPGLSEQEPGGSSQTALAIGLGVGLGVAGEHVGDGGGARSRRWASRNVAVGLRGAGGRGWNGGWAWGRR